MSTPTITEYTERQKISLTVLEDRGLQAGDSPVWPRPFFEYLVRLDYNGSHLDEGYRMGSGRTDVPTAGMVLGTLVADARLYATHIDDLAGYASEIGEEDDLDRAREAYARDRDAHDRLIAWLPGGVSELNTLMFDYDDN